MHVNSKHPNQSGKECVQKNCILCGTPLEVRTVIEDRFCCHGCARVWSVLQHLDPDQGDKYVQAAQALGLIPSTDNSPAQDQVAEACFNVDPEAFQEERFEFTGLECPSCGWVTEKVLKTAHGVRDVHVDFFSETGKIKYDMRQTSPTRIDEFLKPLGYGIKPLGLEQKRIGQQNTFEFVVCAILTVNLMTLSFLRYAESLNWIADSPDYLVWFEMVLCIPVMFIGWLPIARKSIAAISRGLVTMDFLIGSAVLAAFSLSIVALFLGRNDIYFETAAGLITISLLSRMIEARLRARASSDLATLMRMKVSKIRYYDSSGKEEYLGIQEVETGDKITFFEGEIIPFDGKSLSSAILVSEAVLTGEPKPIEKYFHDQIKSGSTVIHGKLILQVERPFHETMLFKISETISQTLDKREGQLRSADRIAHIFAPLVLLFAFCIWCIRFLVGGLGAALEPAGWIPSVTVLAVACPCAFSLAGVTAVTAAVGYLLKHGVLSKEMDQLESIYSINTLLFDKTGTLTEGIMSVERLLWRNQPDTGLLSMALEAEQDSSHPVANAIRAFLNDQDHQQDNTDPYEITDLPGQGRILKNKDITFKIGSGSLFENLFDLDGVSQYHSLVWFGFETMALGCFVLSDSLKVGSRELTSRLINDGYIIELLSGDRTEVSEWTGNILGITTFFGDMTLEDKIAYVKRKQEQGTPVTFVGDGTNDALAMSEAKVSIGLAGATDEALLASGFVILDGDPRRLLVLLKTGKKLHHVILSNYFWAFLYNSIFIPVAALGYLTPLIAMLLMLFSSTSVLLNSLRMKATGGSK